MPPEQCARDARQRAGQIEQRQLVNLHLHRRQLHGDVFARQFVGAAALHFLGGYRRRSLQKLAAETFERPFERGRIELRLGLLAGGLAGAVVGVGGPAEAHHALVDLVAAGVELRQPRGAAEHQRQHAGGDGIERAQVPDLLVRRRCGGPCPPRRAKSSLPVYRLTMTPSKIILSAWVGRRGRVPRSQTLALARQAHVSEREIPVAVETVQKRQDQRRRDQQDGRRE